MKKTIAITALTLAALPSIAFGASCADYPYTPGMSDERVEGGMKFLSTGAATVTFDDPDSVRNAKEEATMMAKARISRFFSEEIHDDSSVERLVNESQNTTSEGTEARREAATTRIRQLRTTSESTLRGVVVLGDCYTKGEEVRVTVGLKPGTIEAAGEAAGSIDESLQSNPTPTGETSSASAQSEQSQSGQAQTGASSQGTTELQGVDGHSNTSRLEDF